MKDIDIRKRMEKLLKEQHRLQRELRTTSLAISGLQDSICDHHKVRRAYDDDGPMERCTACGKLWRDDKAQPITDYS